LRKEIKALRDAKEKTANIDKGGSKTKVTSSQILDQPAGDAQGNVQVHFRWSIS
jgi:hypothetical protein